MLDPNKALFEMPLGITGRELRYYPSTHATYYPYKQDCAYFKTYKDRYLALRRAHAGEIDNLEARLWLDGHFVSPPTAWLRITRHPNPSLGMSVVVVFRGELLNEEIDAQGYLLNCNSDEAVDLYVKKMQQQGCCNWPEVGCYLQQLDRAKQLHAASGNNGKAN